MEKLKNENVIEAGDANYLGEINGFYDLPDNCLFNKVLTGCGGTSVALNNDVPYVICMPYTSLIRNKMEWCNERGIKALPVYSGAADVSDIKVFKGKKIMVTYDSLHKVVKALGKKTMLYKILVDEYHLLITSGGFRYEAVNDVLRLYRDFGKFVFMTATPTKHDYLPEKLKSIPMVTVNWNNIAPVTVDYSIVDYTDLYPSIATIANKFYMGEHEGNAYFFLNSVKGIIQTTNYLKKLEVPAKDIRIVCAKNSENEFDISDSLGPNYYISTVSDIPQKINFLTSTVFEGSDIFDTEGVNYIVSDGLRSHTKYDIMTTIPQIVGRIRDTKYKNWAKLIFSPSTYFSYTSEEEFSKHVMQKLDEARKIVDEFHFVSGPTKELILKSAMSDPYFRVRDNHLEVNETAWCAEMQNYHAMHLTYYVKRESSTGKFVQPKSVTGQINGVQYNYNNLPSDIVLPDKIEGVQLGLWKRRFRDLVEMYKKYYGGLKILSEYDTKKKVQIEKWFPLIPKAFSKIGYDKIVALQYNRRNIDAEILKEEELSNPAKVRQLLDQNVYGIGKRIPFSIIKQDMQEVFDLLGINRTATAANLRAIFAVKECKVRLNNQREHGYIIIGLTNMNYPA